MLRVKRTGQGWMVTLLAPLALLCSSAQSLTAQDLHPSFSPTQSGGSLSELANKRRALLLVKKTGTVDASGGNKAIIDEVMNSDPRMSRRYRLAFNTIALKLNKFMKKYKTMSAARRVDEAEYIIFFNLLEYRWPLGTPYPFGELYVIVKPEPGTGGVPRVVWKSQKVEWAGDAVDKLVDELSLVRWR